MEIVEFDGSYMATPVTGGYQQVLASFDSTHFAMAADAELKSASIDATMLPTPKQISAGCGICLRFAAAQLLRVQEVLDKASVLPATHFFGLDALGDYWPL